MKERGFEDFFSSGIVISQFGLPDMGRIIQAAAANRVFMTINRMNMCNEIKPSTLCANYDVFGVNVKQHGVSLFGNGLKIYTSKKLGSLISNLHFNAVQNKNNQRQLAISVGGREFSSVNTGSLDEYEIVISWHDSDLI